MDNTAHRPPTVGIYTLGCKVNQYESEAIAEYLRARGIDAHPAKSTEVADAYIVNTCTVTAESDRKARQIIRRALSRNPSAPLVVTGCLVETDADSICAIRGVDAVVGNRDKLRAAELLLSLLEHNAKQPTCLRHIPTLHSAPFEPMTIRAFSRTRAYVKIEDGCESHCAYCIIPRARGSIRSKPLADVVDEVRTLTANGCREVVLTGIETASWGKDLNEGNLSELLCAVDAIPNVGRIRLGSLDPSLIKPAFVERIAPLSSLAPHFHLSLQSGSSSVLARMKRKYNRDQALAGIERLRAALPDVMLTTDVIVGFPGETDEEFEQTLDFVRRARFLMVHVFPYSPRAGTVAAALPDQIPPEIKHQRLSTLERLAASIRTELLQEAVDAQLPLQVLFETDADGISTGHTPNFMEVSVASSRPLGGCTLPVLAQAVKQGGEGLIGTLLTPCYINERNQV